MSSDLLSAAVRRQLGLKNLQMEAQSAHSSNLVACYKVSYVVYSKEDLYILLLLADIYWSCQLIIMYITAEFGH